MPALPETTRVTSAADTAAARMEEEIQKLLNQELAEENRLVKRVVVRLGEGQSLMQDEQMPFVEISIGPKEEKSLIVVEEERAYRQRFAGLLGIPEENVEVRMAGRG